MRTMLYPLGIVLVLAFSAGCKSPDFNSAASMEEAASLGSPLIGKAAPDFSLPDQSGKVRTLKELRGKWVVLYFYPKDDTPGCTCQATEFTGLVARFEDANAGVFGISPDAPETHKKFIDKYSLKVTLLSDPQRTVMEQYGAWIMTKLLLNSYGRVIRSTFLIDPEGVIRHHWPEVIPKGHAKRVRNKLVELRYASQGGA